MWFTRFSAPRTLTASEACDLLLSGPEVDTFTAASCWAQVLFND